MHCECQAAPLVDHRPVPMDEQWGLFIDEPLGSAIFESSHWEVALVKFHRCIGKPGPLTPGSLDRRYPASVGYGPEIPRCSSIGRRAVLDSRPKVLRKTDSPGLDLPLPLLHFFCYFRGTQRQGGPFSRTPRGDGRECFLCRLRFCPPQARLFLSLFKAAC